MDGHRGEQRLVGAPGKVFFCNSGAEANEALYKLAWSYYKRDFLIDSIKNFDKSVVLYDSITAQGNTPPLESVTRPMIAL